MVSDMHCTMHSGKCFCLHCDSCLITVSWLPGHSGIVRCLASSGNKIYTAGWVQQPVESANL